MPAFTEQSIRDELAQESRSIFESFLSQTTPYAMFGGFPLGSEFPSILYPYVPGAMNSMRRGEVIAAYRNEVGLRYLRDTSRHLCINNEFAVGAIENTISFTVGTGFKYEVESDSPRLTREAQAIIDGFIDDNDWHDYEQELVRRGFRDGEWFLRFFPQHNGRCQVRVVEPEHVTAGGTNATDDMLYGVQTPAGDVGGWPLNFWVVTDPTRPTPKPIDAASILHVKFNVDRNSKRGLPALYSVGENLERVEKTLRNFAIMAQVMATYAVIRKHKNSGKTAVDNFAKSLQTSSSINPYTGEETPTKQLVPGGVFDAPDATDYEFPASAINVAGYVQTMQADLRAMGCRLVFPEYMISGDASNANYGSTMSAEAPMVRKFQREQQKYVQSFAASRSGSPSVMYRVLSIAEHAGRLPGGSVSLLRIKATPPNLIAKDPNKETQRLSTLNKAGILSKEDWAKAEGLDYVAQLRKGATGDLAGLGLDTATPTMECLATGKTGPCASKFDEPKGTRPMGGDKLASIPGLPDGPSMLDGPSDKPHQTIRDEWKSKFGVDDERPDTSDFTNPDRIDDERTIANALGVPASGVMFDKASGATLLFASPGKGRSPIIVAVRFGVAKDSRRLIRVRPKKDRYETVDVPNSATPAQLAAAAQQLASTE